MSKDTDREQELESRALMAGWRALESQIINELEEKQAWLAAQLARLDEFDELIKDLER